MNFDQRVQRLWYGPAWRSLPLWPLAVLFRLLVGLRRLLYRARLLQSRQVGVPVVVVGNITVGGTGRRPSLDGSRNNSACGAIASAWCCAAMAARTVALRGS